MTLVKRAAALTLAAVMTMAVFTGCTNGAKAPNPDEVVMTVGDTDVKMNIANFFVRYNQSATESMYSQYLGENFWTSEVEKGVTYEEDLKDSLLEQLKSLYVVNAHASDYEIALTDDEKALIESAADAFMEENKDKDAQKLVSGDKDTIVEYLTLMTIGVKVENAFKATVDTNVTDEEAAQKRARYYEIKKSETLEDGTTKNLTEDEIKAAKKQAKAFLKGAKANGSMEAYATEQGVTVSKLTFDADSTTLDEDVIKAADALKENEFSKVIETETGIYVLQLESNFDEEATEANKSTVLTERQNKEFNDTVEKWIKDAKISVDKKAWKKISVHAVKVNYIEDATEEQTTGTTQDIVTDTQE